MWHRTLSTFFAVWVCSAFLCCKSDPPASPEQPETPIQVTLSFKVYNHTQGYGEQRTYEGLSGSELIIMVEDVDIPNTDSRRIAVREQLGSNGYLGEYISFSRNGQVVTVFPNQDSEWHGRARWAPPTS